MSNHKQVMSVLKAFSGQGASLTVPKIFVKLTGDIKAAIFLNQCIFWSDKGSRPDGGFWKSAQEWQDEIFLSRHELDRAREVCAKWVRTEIHRANNKPTAHYYLDFEALVSDLVAMMGEAQQSEAVAVLPESGKTELPESGKTILPESVKPLTVNYQLNTKHNIKQQQQQQPTPDIFKIYEQNIGPLTPIIGQQLAELESDHPNNWPDEWFMELCREAVSNNARNYRYIQTIYVSWKQNGYKVDTRQKKDKRPVSPGGKPQPAPERITAPEGW